jgi:transcriptional regulator with GAF, ATPase, and Fis domain
LIRRPFRPHPGLERLIRGDRLFHIADMKTLESQLDSEVSRSTIERTKVRTCLTVPLRKDATFLGYISAFRLEVRPFSDAEISLLETFAAQAVIAMENARLLSEHREALEQQTATADILRVISSSPTDVQPTFDAIAESAARLCGAASGGVYRFDGSLIHLVSQFGWVPEELEAVRRIYPHPPVGEVSQRVRS